MQTASAPKSHQVSQVLALSHRNRSNRGYRPEDHRHLAKRSCSCGRTLESHVIFDDLCDYCLDEMALESEASAWGCC